MAKQKSDFAEYSYINDLNFYFNHNHFINQDLVLTTFDYFDSGERKGVFVPLEFLNLIHKQYDLIFKNLNTPHDYLQHLKKIPISELQHHILYGFLLRWSREIFDTEKSKEIKTILRLIEREFFKYSGSTPEKIFHEKEERIKQQHEMIVDDILSWPDNNETINFKLKWTGTPSQFGFIIDLLVQGGYLEKPTSSFAKDAELYLKIFDIPTTIKTLTKELSEKTNALSLQNRKKIIIPHKTKLT